ncbi:MAG: Hsp70 family protein [Actinomycetota bacterium]
MTYSLGVDLGSTYTAAAIARDGRTLTVDLGTRASAIPSVVFLREDETVLTGEAAARRGSTEPGRVAREFKRRVGDPTPLLLGGAPYSASALMAKLLRWVVDAVSEREGSPPDRIAVAHPANWGPYKLDLLREAITLADLDDVAVITEPEAAVTYYASLERVEPGAVIAVYDLGGGTFDAAVVRKTTSGVELLGTPAGIERLGGIDFDEAVFSHVAGSLDGALDELDPNDPAATAAVTRLRTECVEAKEALSSDTQVSIPVLLPTVTTEVRLTRAEFEAMIRPPLADTLTAMRRALRSAGVEPEALTAVLLAGGSSRIPLVAQLVGAELGRPVAVDAHPKYGVALGAAVIASESAGRGAEIGADALRASDMPEPTAESPSPVADVQTEAVVVDPDPTIASPAVPSPPQPSPYERNGEPATRGRRKLLAAIAAVVVVLAGVGAAVALGGGNGGDAVAGDTSSTATPDTTTPSETTAPEVEADACADASGQCIEMASVDVDGDSIVVAWTPFNFDPSTADFHAHFFWNTTLPGEAGTNAADFGLSPGTWELTDQRPFVSQDSMLLSAKPSDATEVCVTAGDSGHGVVDPEQFDCLPLPG